MTNKVDRAPNSAYLIEETIKAGEHFEAQRMIDENTLWAEGQADRWRNKFVEVEKLKRGMQ